MISAKPCCRKVNSNVIKIQRNSSIQGYGSKQRSYGKSWDQLYSVGCRPTP
uniref:Uncharacterized protein n=1 Tax=Rhizophora mucronata TaxID=61149 RepID=A0A2P2QFQ7_RHIMU